MRGLVLLAVISLSACASVDIEANQCAAAYDLGYRDAIMGLQPQDLLYEPKCAQKGARLDLAVYRQGWLDGHFDFETRVPHTD